MAILVERKEFAARSSKSPDRQLTEYLNQVCPDDSMIVSVQQSGEASDRGRIMTVEYLITRRVPIPRPVIS